MVKDFQIQFENSNQYSVLSFVLIQLYLLVAYKLMIDRHHVIFSLEICPFLSLSVFNSKSYMLKNVAWQGHYKNCFSIVLIAFFKLILIR